MDMVDKVAEAIFLKEGRAKDVAWQDADKVLALMPVGYGEKPPRVSDYYRGIARAAIEAMLPPLSRGADDAPPLEMVQSVKAAWDQYGMKIEGPTSVAAVACRAALNYLESRAVISAALKEKEG